MFCSFFCELSLEIVLCREIVIRKWRLPTVGEVWPPAGAGRHHLIQHPTPLSLALKRETAGFWVKSASSTWNFQHIFPIFYLLYTYHCSWQYSFLKILASCTLHLHFLSLKHFLNETIYSSIWKDFQIENVSSFQYRAPRISDFFFQLLASILIFFKTYNSSKVVLKIWEMGKVTNLKGSTREGKLNKT